MRVRIDLAYDGTDFHGWARQPGLRTVQSVLEATIAQVLRLGDPPSSVCAGRTDAGVHARGQVVHVDLPEQITPPHHPVLPTVEALDRWLDRALPDDIAVRRIHPAPVGFDARFAATSRRYVYRLWDQWTKIDPLARRFTATCPYPLDVAAMAEAATCLLGLHDFVAFCRPRPEATTIRTLLRLDVERHDDYSIEFTVAADAFCHSMVRSLVGALVAVGRGRRDQDWIKANLGLGQRAGDITVMPACGLTLEEVSYPPEAQLAQRVAQARTRRDDCETR